MLKDTQMLRMELERNGYRVPLVRIATLVKQGKLFPVIRGLYSDTEQIHPFTLSSAICQPSYISFESALSFHGLIPEAVCNVTAATMGKRKTKVYRTAWGAFLYKDIPFLAYQEEVTLHDVGSDSWIMASAEKAFCDKLYSVAPLRGQKALLAWIHEDMRIEPEDFGNLSGATLRRLSSFYCSTNLQLLNHLLGKRL